MAKLMAVGPLAVAFSIAGPAFYSFSPPKTHVSISFFLYLKQRKSVISSYPGCVSVLAARVCVFGSYRSAESLRESNASRPSRANSNFCFFSWNFSFLPKPCYWRRYSNLARESKCGWYKVMSPALLRPFDFFFTTQTNTGSTDWPFLTL